MNEAIKELIMKHPKKTWAIWLGCMDKATSLNEIQKTFNFGDRSLYQDNIAGKMVIVGMIKRFWSENKKTKLYISNKECFSDLK